MDRNKTKRSYELMMLDCPMSKHMSRHQNKIKKHPTNNTTNDIKCKI